MPRHCLAAVLGGKASCRPARPDAAFILALAQSRNAWPIHTKVDEQNRVDLAVGGKDVLETSFVGHFFFFISNKNFSLRTEVLPCPRRVRYADLGLG
jgi:hypothetical protein